MMSGVSDIVDTIKEKCIYFPNNGPYMFGKLPGARYESIINLYPLLLDPYCMKQVYLEFQKIVEDFTGEPIKNFQLAGIESNAVPLMVGLTTWAFTEGYDINSFIIRKQRKSFGMQSYVEGVVNEKPILLVNDLSNSTNAFLHCKNVIENTMNRKTYPFIFSVLNKAKKDIVFDKYLGDTHRILCIANLDDLT